MNSTLFAAHQARSIIPASSVYYYNRPNRTNNPLPSNLPQLYIISQYNIRPSLSYYYPNKVYSSPPPQPLSLPMRSTKYDHYHLEMILIAILILVSMDLVFVRPAKEKSLLSGAD